MTLEGGFLLAQLKNVCKEIIAPLPIFAYE